MIRKAAEYIKERITDEYPIGIICGSGLGQLCDRIENPIYIDYKDIPGFPVSTAPGHKGRFVFGNLSGKKVVCMQGRVHFYEGYTPEQVVMPVRVMSLIGVKTLILTNAAGGINEKYKIGEIMT
ncbi:MAG: purine-nucleoside phosphorylase, partial [Clostridiales bacterium]|nr:purine-nucleoside phosphorylase [Clostridiales bacterium]